MRVRPHRPAARAAITVVLAGIGGALLLPALDKAKDDADRTQAYTIATACKQYYTNHDEMPGNVQVLTQADPANNNKPYLAPDAILDSRKQPFTIDPSGQQSGTEVDVYTTN